MATPRKRNRAQHETTRVESRGLDRSGGAPKSRFFVAAVICAVAVLLAALWQLGYLGGGDDTDREGTSSAAAPPQAIADEGTIPVHRGKTWKELDDPTQDGWHTEVFSQKADKQLKQFAAQLVAMVRGQTSGDKDIRPLVTDAFACEALMPEHLRAVFEDDGLRIERAEIDKGPPKLPHRGAAGLVAALDHMTAPWHGASDLRAKFKIFRIFESGDAIVTRQYLEVFGSAGSGTVEQNAIWEIHWERPRENEPPRMARIDVQRFEQVRSASRTPIFTDCTQSVIGHNDCYRRQLLFGMNHWLARIQDTHSTTPFGTPGVALGDVNGDGLDDLYLCQETGLPNKLFIQNPDGTADDVSEDSGVDWLSGARCALFFDVENDGDQDLAVAFVGHVVLAENNGKGKFTIRRVVATSEDNVSLTAADYDADGDLDFYVGSYSPDEKIDDSPRGGVSVPTGDFIYHDANDGAANALFRNDGDWGFSNVTVEVGLHENNTRRTLAVAWEDWDNDGDQDLYVANDYGRNNMYRNDGAEGFVDIADALGVEDRASGMSVTWGDYNRDGHMDLYVSNMFSSAGNRVTFQDTFKPGVPGEERARFQRFAKGNTLYRNSGAGGFEDLSESASVAMGRWAWSSNFADINNDGWDDLVVANGYMTTDDSGDL